MGKLLPAVLLLLIVGCAGWRLWQRDAAAGDFARLPGAERVARARKAREEILRAQCQRFGLPYPPREIFLRAFKQEAELEVWAREDSGPWKALLTLPVLASSGGPGPKRREGDRQVPEGFYRIDRFNPQSAFHLSLGIDYPNAADRILSHRERPGGDIFIHGKMVTIGCLPLGDAGIEELYVLALDARDRGQKSIPVHIFPARMSGEPWAKFSAAHPELQAFWAQLQPAYQAFEGTRRLPEIAVDAKGGYVVGKVRE